MSLFDGEPKAQRTVAHCAAGRTHAPAQPEEFSGQEHLVGPGKPLRVQIEREAADSASSGSANTGSMILWGPPGVGKTTLAKIIAETTQATFIEFSAVMSGIKEIKQVMAAAAQASKCTRAPSFSSMRFTASTRPAGCLLPYVERGTIRLIGATTENPSFEIISALLSAAESMCWSRSPRSRSRLFSPGFGRQERGLGALGLTADDDALELMPATPAATAATPITRWKWPRNWRKSRLRKIENKCQGTTSVVPYRPQRKMGL